MFEPASPDTFAYLLLGLGVVTLITGGFIGSIIVRYRNLQRDLQTLDELEAE